MRVKEWLTMAHMMKHTRASCGHMFAHYDRQAEHISNENVDRERTYLNYNLATIFSSISNLVIFVRLLV